MDREMKRDFLRLSDLSAAEHETLFHRAVQLKKERAAGRLHQTMRGKILALVFEKASTRTRLSFEAGMMQLGGSAVVLDSQGSQMARGEPPEDTARVTSRYVDGIMYRTFSEERLQLFAKAATVPVINGLSDGGHPVQLLADLMTVRERLGGIAGKRVAFLGDCTSNVARSWIEAASLFGFELRLGAPDAHAPSAADLRDARGAARLVNAPAEAVRDADVVCTDVWASMGQEEESARRRVALAGYGVDAALVKQAAAHAIVLHCLPAHRGEEISAEVIDGSQSAIFDEAENRMHAQMALVELLLGAARTLI
jgi:ornithine carbamoyltransferase